MPKEQLTRLSRRNRVIILQPARDFICHQYAASAQWLTPHHSFLPNVKHVIHPHLHQLVSSTQVRRDSDLLEQ